MNEQTIMFHEICYIFVYFVTERRKNMEYCRTLQWYLDPEKVNYIRIVFGGKMYHLVIGFSNTEITVADSFSREELEKEMDKIYNELY